ncbi:MAG TPA: pseudouridine synthase [Candidatus Saccharimonadales bacterium]|nr:pseudouridine synthase [Candidatus Saccharimonadales bacterium]
MSTRINKYVAQATGCSRRQADKLIAEGVVTLNGKPAILGDKVVDGDTITVEGKTIKEPAPTKTILLNKPRGFVSSRNGQGSKTIYDLLPEELWSLKSVGRLDKDSSGLLILTNDGNLAFQLSHPTQAKMKIYEVNLDKELTEHDRLSIVTKGVKLADGLSRFSVERTNSQPSFLRISMGEGRNRQIRRTFEALGYKVTKLHRTHFGQYDLGRLQEGTYLEI